MRLGLATLERYARLELDGVGDPSLGEWREWSGRAFHLRRRLSDVEAVVVGPPVDVRGTPEQVRRHAAVASLLPFPVPPL